ncbi:anti-sigma regulatory factor (Ser/Thr protein kinase) [Streptomyces sp. V3I8]|uniref:sensor histidine kinase n=1 Tax=Streptomyces sp. V3I8 TaxID=3042279 RepID=UPI00278B520F|nr:sensor histidine kinase [Streptomyces sp. V3I8]MDQ1033687.1 anti-sigma regulatory factor (Ser/Thr protein kinase) [Streptomyces sp. V3I8]
MTADTTTPRPHAGSAPRLTHQALVYDSEETFLSSTVPFCLDGLDADDAVLAVTTGANIGLLRQALDDAAREIEFVDADDWYHAPGHTLGAYHRYVDRRTAGGRHRRVRVIGEPVWRGRDALETLEWTRYESAINVAFADCPAWIVCPYDTRSLPEDVVAGARRTHPELVADARARISEHYAAPAGRHGPWRRPLEPVLADGEHAVTDFGTDLSVLRGFVARTADTLGVHGDRAQRLVFAVNEVATNALQHGGGHGQVTLRRSGHRVVCDITDPGDVLGPDWYLGYLPPGAGQRSGHGLWAVRQLCDLMEVDATPGRTTVRLHLDLRPPSPPRV